MCNKILLSEKIAEDIRRLIIENTYKPGEKLPNETELTQQLHVSRSTIREAIKILISLNILEIRRGNGTFVCENPGITNDPLGIAFMNKKDLLYYHFETRLIIEPEITALAAQRATDENIKKLEEAAAKVEKDIIEDRDHSQNDIIFHNIISLSSHNPIIQRVGPIINESIIAGTLKSRSIPKSIGETIKHHNNILKAIKDKNPELARMRMKEHIQFGINLITLDD